MNAILWVIKYVIYMNITIYPSKFLIKMSLIILGEGHDSHNDSMAYPNSNAKIKHE